MYRDGKGVTRDVVHAVALFRLACDRGAATGCYRLGNSYLLGNGVEKNSQTAAMLFRTSCDANELSACVSLGRLLKVGNGVQKDVGAAVALFKRACDAERAWGCANLADCYHNGEGVAKDERLASQLYEHSCNRGQFSACTMVGIEHDADGPTPDPKAAEAAYGKACDGGQGNACAFLADLKNGNDSDMGAAFPFYTRGCDLNNAVSCHMVGLIRFYGLGVSPDRSLALGAFTRACTLGDQESCAYSTQVNEMQHPRQEAMTQQVAGFRLGSTRPDVVSKCRAAGRVVDTTASGGAVVCSGSAEPIGFDAVVRIDFCAGKACSVSVIRSRTSAEATDTAWLQAFDSLRAKLADKYGAPSRDEEKIPDECRTEVVPCLREGRATHFAGWTWYTSDGSPASFVALDFYTVETHDVDAISILYVNSEGMRQRVLQQAKERENL
jgi:TPR repeat protein